MGYRKIFDKQEVVACQTWKSIRRYNSSLLTSRPNIKSVRRQIDRNVS